MNFRSKLLLMVPIAVFTPIAKGMQFDGHTSEFDEWLLGVAIFAPIGILMTVLSVITCIVFCGRKVDGEKKPGYVAAILALFTAPLIYVIVFTLINWIFWT